MKRAPSVNAELDKRRTSTSVSFEDAISAKLLELKLLQADDCVVVRQFDTSPKVRCAALIDYYSTLIRTLSVYGKMVAKNICL